MKKIVFCILFFVLLLFLFSFGSDVFALTFTNDSGLSYIYNSFFQYEDVEYSEDYGYTCTYDLHTSKGYFTGTFFIKDEMLVNQKYVLVFYPDTQDIYYFHVTDDSVTTIYGYKCRGYNEATYYSTNGNIVLGSPGEIGSIDVYKFNKETLVWDEQSIGMRNLFLDITGYFYFESSGYENLGIIDPECVIGYSGLEIKIRVYNSSVSSSSGYAIEDNLFYYRGYSCFLPQLSSASNTTIDYFLGTFRYYETDSLVGSDYYAYFGDASVLVTVKQVSTGQMFTTRYYLDTDDMFYYFNVGELLASFNTINTYDYLITFDFVTSLYKYGASSSEAYIKTMYYYTAVYSFSYDNTNGFIDFNFDSDTAGTSGFFDYNSDSSDSILDTIADTIVSIFVPSEDFFSDWVSDMNSVFGNRLGILYFPFEMLIDFFNLVSTLGETDTAIISVPEFSLSWGNWSATFWTDMSYDLNSLLSNDTFLGLHEIYLLFVDVILWIGFIYLASRCVSHVVGTMTESGFEAVESSIRSSDEYQDEKAYKSYVRYERAKNRYQNEMDRSRRRSNKNENS